MNLTAQEAALAWAQGKKVEAFTHGLSNWMPVTPIGVERTVGSLYPSAFCLDTYQYRFAPEPKLRPLTIEEWRGHLGAGVVFKANGDLSTIGGVSPGRELVSVYANQGFSPEEMLEKFTFISGHPCGVMEGGAA